MDSPLGDVGIVYPWRRESWILKTDEGNNRTNYNQLSYSSGELKLLYIFLFCSLHARNVLTRRNGPRRENFLGQRRQAALFESRDLRLQELAQGKPLV